MEDLAKDILLNPYQNYIYSYPHKTAYWRFPEPIPLKPLWGTSAAKKLTLYIHIPFCMHKCGYCNLFSSTSCDTAVISKYVDKLIEEMKAVSAFLAIEDQGNVVSNVIFGGGTPSILADFDLQRLLKALADILHIDFTQVFFSTEISPSTITENKLELFARYNIDRISIGVQSFHAHELQKMGRIEPVQEIEKALKLLSTINVPTRNVDLMYGIPSQTLKTWKMTLQHSLEYTPEEIYIYPIYVREQTGLYTKATRDIPLMLSMYEFARDFLWENNYLQTSMRNFIRADIKARLLPEYSCQENEMIGIGCGARSYKANVHYSKKYAVEQSNINKIIDDYLHETDFSFAHYGYILNEQELKRRYILKSILKVSGLAMDDYRHKFQASPLAEFPELAFLIENEFLINKENRVYPTEKGLMYSDAIGSLFISNEVAGKMRDFQENR